MPHAYDQCDNEPTMSSRTALFVFGAVLVTGLGISAARAQQKAASGPSVVVYKSPT
jgi:hypothetical protein